MGIEVDGHRSRGIYMVANRNSQSLCDNLIYSIRMAGCVLPIRIIDFGGDKYKVPCNYSDIKVCDAEQFGKEANLFVNILQEAMPECNPGFFRRYLAWFGEFDEFLYTDNDIVALIDWTEMFEYLDKYTIVHADHEYDTQGRYNFKKIDTVEKLYGEKIYDYAITAGHFLCKKSPKHVLDIKSALNWMKDHSEAVKWHDQTLLQMSCLLGEWKKINLCRHPYNWGSSWHGDYKNVLDVMHTIQQGKRISHIHYSGYTPRGVEPMEELLVSSENNKVRSKMVFFNMLKEIIGVNCVINYYKKARRVLRSVVSKVRSMW